MEREGTNLQIEHRNLHGWNADAECSLLIRSTSAANIATEGTRPLF